VRGVRLRVDHDGRRPGTARTPDSPAAPLSPATSYRLAGPGVVRSRLRRRPPPTSRAGRTIAVRFSDDETFEAQVAARDTDTELAVVGVAVPSSLLHPLAFGESERAQIGEREIAIGSPSDRRIESPDDLPVDALRTDAPLNPATPAARSGGSPAGR
jgi:hypothetical protein